MKIKQLSDYSPEQIKTLLNRIPFFKDLLRVDSTQTQTLLNYSCIVELEAGEVIMRRGDRGSWMYFLLNGKLAVYHDEPEPGTSLNYISAGELLGDLALLCEHERKATVAADNGNKKTVLFATDFKVFGQLLDFSTVNLMAKLLFYRTMVHSIRWRLEVKRMAEPDNILAKSLLQYPAYRGEKDGVEELQALCKQARHLGDILECWNSQSVDDGGEEENAAEERAV
jgi:hypothetical protein